MTDFFAKAEEPLEGEVEPVGAKPIQSLSHRHHAMIDWLLANPGAKSMAPLSAKMNVTRSWLSTIMKSDVFREEFTRRRQELDSRLSADIVSKQLSITLKALDKLDDVLDIETEDLDPRLVLDVADRTAKSLGFGASRGNAPNLLRKETVEETFVESVTPGVLERARKRIKSVEHYDAVSAADG